MSSSEANDMNEWPITPDILGIETATICNNGSKEQEITFHTKPLARLSPKFAQFCCRKKQPDGRFTLACAQKKYDAFTCIALYAYHGKVPTPPKDLDSIYTQRLRWIYYVAEEFALNDLMNKTIDALRAYDFKYRQEIHVHAEEIYQNTSKGSLLRWYCAASAAWSWGRESGPATSSQRDNRKKLISSGRGNPDIFADFHLVDLFHRDHIRGFDTDWRDVSDSVLPVCAFHCHAPGETCHRTGITEPAEVAEHISEALDGAEDTILLERSQIIDAPSDQELRSSAQQSTPPRSPVTNIHQNEDSNQPPADAGNNIPSLFGAVNGPIRSSVIQSHGTGTTNGDQKMRLHQESTATLSKVREREQTSKSSPAIPLAPIRNPPLTRVVPPENVKIDCSHKKFPADLKEEASAEDLYGVSDIEMDCEDSRSPAKLAKEAIGSSTYDEQLANAWGVSLSSLPPKKTRIVPGTVLAGVKAGDSKCSRAKRAVPDTRESPNLVKDRDENEHSRMSTKKRRAISSKEGSHEDSRSAITKKSKTTHAGTHVFTKALESHKVVAKIQSEIQDSETESSSEEDSSEHSSSEEDDEDEDDEDEDDEIIDDYSSDEEESSYEDEESTSQAGMHQDHNSSDDEVEEQEPEQLFIDSGIHSHTSSKATSTSFLIPSQPSFGPQVTSSSRNIAGMAPLRPGYCLIYNYKGRCNKACGLQHLCLKCDLQHSSLHHDKYQPNFRAVNTNSSIETCPDWNAGRCAVRVTTCTLRHICSICKGGHRSIYHEHEDAFPKRDQQRSDRTTADSNHFRQEGRLDHHHSQVNSPHISTSVPETWSEDFHSPSRRHASTRNEEVSAQDQRFEGQFASCQMWQRGTCIRKRTRCQLAHVCERCGQLTHRTAKHDTYMSKTAPRA